MSLIFVDCEAYGGCPSVGQLTEFGAVEYDTGEEFYRRIVKTEPSKENSAIPLPVEEVNQSVELEAFVSFEVWALKFKGRPVFVSDNNGYDWQWINDGFWRLLGRNPFGHSSRRISDFYAGTERNFYKTQDWKQWRKTPHDHNPVNDARGNLEAFKEILKSIGK